MNFKKTSFIVIQQSGVGREVNHGFVLRFPRTGVAGKQVKVRSEKMKRVTSFASAAAVVLALVGMLIGLTFARATNQDIVETAVGAGQFKTLAAALKAADLVGTLKGDGPFTVFAPTDAAFAKLPAV